MLIALLAILGVNLIVLVFAVVAALGRRRWVSRQDGAVRGTARVIKGEVAQLSIRPKRGYGRWVRDVLVWTPAPFFLRNALVPVDRVVETRPARKVGRLGDHPQAVTLSADGAHIEITVRKEDLALVAQSFSGMTPTTAGIPVEDNEPSEKETPFFPRP